MAVNTIDKLQFLSFIVYNDNTGRYDLYVVGARRRTVPSGN